MEKHHKKELWFLIGFLLVFFLLFIIALSDTKRGIPVFNIGIPYLVEDIVILVLSFSLLSD